MMLDHMIEVATKSPLMDTAWTILEAANDLGDLTTVEICRRVIDATLCDRTPEQSDLNTVFEFFD
jgi:hypothetical protein